MCIEKLLRYSGGKEPERKKRGERERCYDELVASPGIYIHIHIIGIRESARRCEAPQRGEDEARREAGRRERERDGRSRASTT